MIIATGGHVDHGKSTLVRRLTGTDPDRWAEERERGLTIDLGFAWTTLPSGREAAFVDVPGHRRFVANALAGSSHVDGVLLAVSAREGWKPQTEEHLAMFELLGAPTGVVALTFADTVDAAGRARAEAEVRDRLAGTFLEGAPVVSTRDDGGTDDALRQALDEAVTRCPTEADLRRPRLWIDRSFVLDGVGRVVTGTLAGGRLEVGQRVVATDGGRSCELRIRSVRSNGRPVPQALPGWRVALAVRGRGPAPHRGQAVIDPAQWAEGRLLHVAIQPTRGAGVPTQRGSYFVHLGTWSAGARIAHPPSSDGVARLHLASPAGPFAPGDRFVLRDVGRDATVAGGTVLAIDGAGVRYPPDALVARAAAVSLAPSARPRRLAAALTAERGGFAPAASVEAATGETQPVGTRTMAGSIVSIVALRRARGALLERLRVNSPLPAPTEGLDRLGATSLVARGDVIERDGLLHLPGTSADARVVRAVELLDDAVRQGRLGPLITAEQAGSVADLDGRDLRRLIELDLAVSVPPFFATSPTYAALVSAIGERLAAGPATTAELKVVVGLSRKHAIALLEALDDRCLTRRVGDRREAAGRS